MSKAAVNHSLPAKIVKMHSFCFGIVCYVICNKIRIFFWFLGRNTSLAHKARSVKLTEANKENCPEPVRPEKEATKQGSRLPVPVKKFKVKSVPDFKKLHQNWDRNFQKVRLA